MRTKVVRKEEQQRKQTKMKTKILNSAPRPRYANLKSYLKSRRLLARAKTSKRVEIMQKVDEIIENDDYFSQLMEKLVLESDDNTVGTEAMGESFSSLSDSSFNCRKEKEDERIHHAVWVWNSGNLQDEDPDWKQLQAAFGGVALIKNSSGRVRIEDESMVPGVYA